MATEIDTSSQLLQQQLSTPSSDDAEPDQADQQNLNISTDSGDYDLPPPVMAPPKSKHPRKHRMVSASAVTADARRVLEQFLRMMDSPHDLSGGKYEHQYAVVGDILPDPQPTPYQPMGSDDDSVADVRDNIFKRKCERLASTESDYVDCQKLASQTTNSNSSSSKASLLCPSTKSHSPPGAVKFAVVPQGKPRDKIKASEEHNDGSSSSSTEDYEFPDTELLNRKKKSSFRLAFERVQQSFRRQGKKEPSSGKKSAARDSSVPAELISKFDVPLPPPPTQQTPKSGRLGGLQREDSEKGKTNSSGTPSDYGCELRNRTDAERLTLASLRLSAGIVETVGQDKRKKSPLPWKKFDGKEKNKEEKTKENRGIFEGILRQFRKGSSKLRRKGAQVGGHRSRSADNLAIRPPTKEEKKLLKQFAPPISRDTDYDSDYAAVRYRSGYIDPTTPCLPRASPIQQRLLRKNMQLEGLVPCRPQMPLPPAMEVTESSTGFDIPIGELTADDEVDAGFLAIGNMFTQSSSKPFSEKSDREKDELFEKIAEQLAAIADHYNLDSPCNSKKCLMSDAEQETSAKTVDAPVNTDPSESKPVTLDTYVPRQASKHSDEECTHSPVVAQLIETPNYSRFKQIVTANVGDETGWYQIARMFRLTQSAVHLAGMGTAVAGQIKEMTLRYFEDRFADWIAGQGGWESMVEDNTEQDSELD